jgi:hypothetical protein
MFSKKFKNELRRHMNKGYKLGKAKVNMIVYWKSEDAQEETRILLAEIALVERKY